MSKDELIEKYGAESARDIEGLEGAEKKISAVNARLISKIELIDIQHDNEKDPRVRVELGKILEEYKRTKEILNLDVLKNHKKLDKILLRYTMNPDSQMSLKDRVKDIFDIKGRTLAAVISIVIMFFSLLGLSISNALKGSSGGGGGGGGGGKPPSIPDRVKEGLKKFAEWLKYLAGKSAAAIPGIIGSIVSFLLKTIGQVVGFAAEHVMIFLVLVVSSIIYGLIEGVKEIKKSRN